MREGSVGERWLDGYVQPRWLKGKTTPRVWEVLVRVLQIENNLPPPLLLLLLRVLGEKRAFRGVPHPPQCSWGRGERALRAVTPLLRCGGSRASVSHLGGSAHAAVHGAGPSPARSAPPAAACGVCSLFANKTGEEKTATTAKKTLQAK